MRIQFKIISLVMTLMALTISATAANLIFVQRRQLRVEYYSRIDAMMEGMERIARESLRSNDEIMLLSYIKELIRDFPEIELALISRKGHSSVLGEVKTELDYKTITIDEGSAAAQPSDAGGVKALPRGVLVIQIGLSKTVLEGRIREAQDHMVSQVLAIAGTSLLLGLIGSWWIGRRLSMPIVALTRSIQHVAGKGNEDGSLDGDELVYLQTQFEGMKTRIEDLLRSKEDLVMTLTHELNNPLTGLKSLVGLLQAPIPLSKADTLDYLRTMGEAISSMESSVSNALHIFRLETKPSLKLEAVNVDEVMEQVLRLFRPVAASRGLKLEEAVKAAVSLQADEELIKRVLVNLISNACKYASEGGIVRVGLKDLDANVELSVYNDGPAITKEARERLFTRFYRVPGQERKRIPGTGLGLVIVKQAVDMHKGTITVDSENGKGTVFKVILPKGRAAVGV